LSVTATNEIRAVVDQIRRQQVMDVVRAAAFIGTLLLVWVSLHPFVDISGIQLKDVTTGNETLTYAAFGCLALLTVALAMRDNKRGLLSLLSPGFMLFAGWVLITVVLSLDPSTSIRRFALTACVIAVASTLMLVPKSQTELMRWLSVAALALLAICYLGVVLAPNLSMHLAIDAQEPALAGDWRGSFGHKNAAAPVMVMLLFIGIYICRMGARLSGAAIIGFAGVFLLFSGGKSAFALCIVVFLVTGLISAIRWLWLRAVVCFTPLLALNLLSVGTVMSDGLENIARMLPFDTTFTGRTDIWTFAFQSLQQRLSIGYGFAAFWGSRSVKDLPEGKEWAEFASHSHNGYLDTALAMGLPGLLLLIAVLVIGPLKDFHAADRGGNSGPLATMLLQIWLFGLYLSSMESFFLDRADPLWFMFLLGVFGLHYLARFRISN
jgi:O-antigen ligase